MIAQVIFGIDVIVCHTKIVAHENPQG